MFQFIKDARREREISNLARLCREAFEAGDKTTAAWHFHAMRRAINERSPAQVARMERRMGLRARTTIKRNVMGAFLRGAVPAWTVVLVFRIFKLRRL